MRKNNKYLTSLVSSARAANSKNRHAEHTSAFLVSAGRAYFENTFFCVLLRLKLKKYPVSVKRGRIQEARDARALPAVSKKIRRNLFDDRNME